MNRAIFSAAIFFVTCFLFQGMALATGGSWGHHHSNTPKVHNLADILKSGEIVGAVDFCGPEGTNGAVVDLVGESFQAVLGASGEFKLRYVPRGAYTLRVNIPGQPDHTQAVTVKKRIVTNVGEIALCPDNDDDGFALDVDCNDNNGEIFPGAEELCDGIDNDCDGEVDGPGCDCTDADNDGFFAQDGCGTAVDCNDDNDIIKPGATEICDGVDNNCDNTIDEGFDLSTDLNNCGACSNACSGVCQAGACFAVCGNGVLENGEECDDGNTSDGDECQADCTLPPVTCPGGIPVGEIVPCDGPDNDACEGGTQTCQSDGQFSACDEAPGSGNVEICNGIDDNCDGQTDEGTAEGECNDGNICTADVCNSSSGCSNTFLPPGTACGSGLSCDGNGTCVPEVCGNGILEGMEQCDDGNNIDGDGCQADCTNSECTNNSQCPDQSNASGVCESDGTCGFTCSNGFADCDGNPQNGCEDLLNNNPSCDSFTSLGAVSGDTGGSSVSSSGRGEKVFIVRVDENDANVALGHDLGVRINLTVPQGADYDLEATCDNCGAPTRVSTNPGSANEQIFLRWDEKETCTLGLCVPSGSDSGRNIYIRVVFKSADVCDDWTLTVAGNLFSGANTCSEK